MEEIDYFLLKVGGGGGNLGFVLFVQVCGD